jgi:hypothetical protein
MNYNKNKCEKKKFGGKVKKDRVFLQGFLSKSFRYYLSAK